jgi:subtilisin family serine protease
MRRKLRHGVRLLTACVLFGHFGTAAAFVEPSPFQAAAHHTSHPSAKSRGVFAPGRVIVQYEPRTTPVERRGLRARADVTLERPLLLPRAQLVVVKGSVRDAVANLERRPKVAYAERDNVVYGAASAPNDPDFGSLWGLRNTGQTVNGTAGVAGVDVNVLPAWKTTRGAGQVIAVVDTGVANDQPDLAPNFWSSPGEIRGNGVDDDGNGYIDDVRGWDFVDSDGNPTAASNWHGTAVAGAAAAVSNNSIGISGVAPAAKIMTVRALDDAMQGYVSTLADGVVYAADEGADVINLSLVTSGTGFPQALSDAVDVARARGAVVVAAAANYARNNDSVPTYPCDLPQANLICVASIDQLGALSSFSDYGAANVDVGAPGSNILSPLLSGYEFKNGTSLATPHVSGVAALIRAIEPSLSADEVVKVIEHAAVPLSSLAGKTSTGGRVDAAAAVAAVVPDTTIISGPSGPTNDPTPSFSFSSSDVGSRFKCRVDSQPYGACRSPTTLSHLNDGSHTLYVRATDPAGNTDATPASRTFSDQTASVSVSGTTLVVTAAPGAKDNLAITRPSHSTLRVTDSPNGVYTGSGIHTSSGCVPSGDYTADCNATGITPMLPVLVTAADRADKVVNSTGLSSSLYGEGGADLLIGGSANDRLKGGPGADVLRGMDGNDLLRANDGASDQAINCDGGNANGHADEADLDLVPKDPSSAVKGCETKTRH